MSRLFLRCLTAMFFVLCTVSFGADVKVLPLNAPNLPNEKLYTTITVQVLNAVQEAGCRSVEKADYALRVSVLNPKGSLMVGAEVRGVKSFYKKETVNVSNVSMLNDAIRQVVGAALKEIPAASGVDDMGEVPSEEPLVKVDTVTKSDSVTRVDTIARVDTVVRADTVTRVDTIVRVDTVAKVDTIVKVNTITVVDTVVRADANLPKKSFHNIMVGFSFADFFFLRRHTERYKTATPRDYYYYDTDYYYGTSYYDRRYDIYNTYKEYTTEEQSSSNQFNLGYAYESSLNTRLSKVYSVSFGFNDSDWLLAFAGNLKFDLIEKPPSRKWDLFVQGGLGPVFAYVGSFHVIGWSNGKTCNAIESLGYQIDDSFHLGLVFDVALGFDFDINEKSKLEFAVKVEQVWLDFLDKLIGNRMFAITPYVAYGF
jgi:hypothetical protein